MNPNGKNKPEMSKIGRSIMHDSASISGYDYGAGGLLRSPVTLDDLDLLKPTVNLQEEDMRYL